MVAGFRGHLWNQREQPWLNRQIDDAILRLGLRRRGRLSALQVPLGYLRGPGVRGAIGAFVIDSADRVEASSAEAQQWDQFVAGAPGGDLVQTTGVGRFQARAWI